MKTKSLLLAFVGLGLFACSNEDLNNGGAINGDATVTVNISEILSKAPETPSTGDDNATFPVQINSAKLTLVADKGSAQDVDITKMFNNGETTHQFTGVRNPKSITVVINDGKADGLALKDVVGTQLSEPLYATSTSFTATSNTEYTVTLTPVHRLARLQFSDIDFKQDGSSYSALTIDGIYLNGALLTEGGTDVLEENGEGAWDKISEGVNAWDVKVWDRISADALTEGPWPTDNQCYAYNILPNGKNLPKLTVCFSDAEQANVTASSKLRYARVNKYVKTAVGNEEITEFKAGYIYNITNLEIEDSDLGPTPEGGEDISLTATVEVTPWTLINGTVEWK